MIAQRRHAGARLAGVLALAAVALVGVRSDAADPPPATPGVFSGAAASVSQGVATATLAMPLPPGRGVQPSLTLRYSSAAGIGDAASGWGLGLAGIERAPLSGWPRYADPLVGEAMAPLAVEDRADCVKHGPLKNGKRECLEEGPVIPGHPAMDRFVVAGQDLVPICSVAHDGCPVGETMPTWAALDGGWHYFRLQRDTHTRFFWSPNGRTWRIVDTDTGNTTEMGEPLVAQSVWGESLDIDTNANDKPVRWLISREYDAVRDAGGQPVNVAAYRWTGPAKRHYLTEIFYTPRAVAGGVNDEHAYAHHVTLVWESLHPDWVPIVDRGLPMPSRAFKDVAPAWRAKPSMRLARVDVASKPASGDGDRDQVRRFYLTYENKGRASRAYLHSFQMEGRCPGTVEQTWTINSPQRQGVTLRRLPDASLCERDRLPPTVLTYSDAAPARDLAWTTLPAQITEPSEVTPLDVTSDGLTDLVQPSLGGPSQVMLVNVAGTALRPQEILISGNQAADVARKLLSSTRGASQIGEWSAFGNASVFLQTPNPCQAGGTCVASKTEPVVAATLDANGWWQWKTVGSVPTIPSFDQLGDIDGDGLLDRRYLRPQGQACEAQVDFPDRKADGVILPSANRGTCNAGLYPDSYRTPRRFFLADMNGDSLADLVVAWGYCATCGRNYNHLTFFLGDGKGGFQDEASWPPNQGSGLVTAPPWLGGVVSDLDDVKDLSLAHVVDLNGDGLSDFAVEGRGGGDQLAVQFNADGGLLEAADWMPYPPGVQVGTRSFFADMNGNGTQDFVLVTSTAVHYVDFRPGAPEGLLVRIDNGMGAATGIDYASTTDLDVQATNAGTPWQTHTPQVGYVATGVTDFVKGSSRTARRTQVTYAYKNPAYDGWRRALRGFGEIITTVPGDGTDPTSVRWTRHTFSACHQLPFRENRGGCLLASNLDDDPEETTAGWAAESIAHDGMGTRLSQRQWVPTHDAATWIKGMDNRTVKSAYVSETHTWLYDTTLRNELDKQPFSIVVRDSTSPDRFSRVTGTITLGSAKGRTHLHTRRTVDANGNETLAADDGRLGDEGGPKDDPIVTHTDWTQVSAESGALFRPTLRVVDTFPTRGATPRVEPRTVRFVHNAFGQLVDTTAELHGTLRLQRTHEDPSRQFALAPASASQDGPILVEHIEYDSYGNAKLMTTPGGGRTEVTAFDTAYAQYAAVTETSTGSNTPPLRSFILSFDRAFGVPLSTMGPNGAVSIVELDAFGRTKRVFAPDPDSGTPILATTVDYHSLAPGKGRPNASGWAIHVKSEPGSGSTTESWTFLDGQGSAVLELTPGDRTGEYIAQGLTLRGAKGSPIETLEPWIYTGAPLAHSLELPAGVATRTATYDPFGRVTVTTGLDGKPDSRRTYRGLAVDFEDAETMKLGGTHAGNLRRVERDGHGRVEAVQAYGKIGGGAPSAVTTRYRYQATGEVAVIEQARGTEKITRWMQHDSLGRLVMNAEPNTARSFAADPLNNGAVTAMRAWLYAYDDRGLLVGTSDARGCGVNSHYDAAGRLLAEDYSPCLNTQAEYTPPDLQTGNGTELFNVYAGTGELTASHDRGASTGYSSDYRRRVTHVAKRMAKPGAPALDLAQRYAAWTFASGATFDLGDRLVRQQSGADVDELLAPDPVINGLTSDVLYAYSPRGAVANVKSSFGTLMKSQTIDPDGFVRETIFGDVADNDAVETVAKRTPDGLRRLGSYELKHPTIPADWQASNLPSHKQTLAAWTFGYDAVGNVESIHDDRTEEWPAGAKPVHRTMKYDDFYRVTDVTYDSGDDVQAALFAGIDRPVLPRSLLTKRVQKQHFDYGWQGNTTATSSDAAGAASTEAAFFDRSLGPIKNGDGTGARPNQLTAAGPGLVTPTSRSALTARYDDAGNMTYLMVARATCADPAGKCSHAFVYDWDEIGNLARARRWDSADPRSFDNGAYVTTAPAVDLQYAYSGSTRVRKTAVDGAEQRHTVDVFGSLRLKSAKWDGANYERTKLTEQVYLGGLAHVSVFKDDRAHVLLALGDELGSTSVVIDKKTGELVERASYQAYGEPDSDLRTDRWGSFREDFRFTGKEDDAEVGLTYFGARYYHSALGRWLSADPLTVHAAGSDLNPYAYVSGSPTNLVDPLGLEGGCMGKESGCTAAPGLPMPGADIRIPSGGGNGGDQGCSAASGCNSARESSAQAKEREENEAERVKAHNAWLAGPGRFQQPSTGTFNPRAGSKLQSLILDSNGWFADQFQNDKNLQAWQWRWGAVSVAAVTLATGGAAASASGWSWGSAYAALFNTGVTASNAAAPIIAGLNGTNMVVRTGILAGGAAYGLARGAGSGAGSAPPSLPYQLHHFATNKSGSFTAAFEEIAGKYGLSLDEVWNTELLPHLGRHPEEYHQFVLQGMRAADQAAQGNLVRFLEEFGTRVKDVVRENPGMLRKAWWQ